MKIAQYITSNLIGRLSLKQVLEISLHKKAILFLECRTDDNANDHAIVVLPYQSVLVCRNNEYIKILKDDLENTRDVFKAMQSSFGFQQVKTAYFVAIKADHDGRAAKGTSHVDGH